MELANARVLITGGATGIGRAVAAELIAGGARVAICGRRAERLDSARDELGVVAIQGDVSVDADATRIVTEAAEALGGLDVLVNNAAVGYFAKLLDTDVAEIERVFATNVVGATLMARECARIFVAQDAGTIINVGSTAAQKGFPGGSAYAASKFALTALTECWRAELRQHNVRVMQMNPSEVQTEFGRGGQPRTEYDPTRLRAEDVAHVIVSLITLEQRGFVTDTTLWATRPAPRS